MFFSYHPMLRKFGDISLLTATVGRKTRLIVDPTKTKKVVFLSTKVTNDKSLNLKCWGRINLESCIIPGNTPDQVRHRCLTAKISNSFKLQFYSDRCCQLNRIALCVNLYFVFLMSEVCRFEPCPSRLYSFALSRVL